MSKKGKTYRLWAGLALLVAVIVLAVVIVVNAMGGKSTGDVTISGGSTVEGLSCKNRTLIHPAFSSKPAISYSNKITAIFNDNKLSSISLLAEGIYETEKMAEEGKAFAEAAYNITLTDKLGEKIDVFSHSFSVNGERLQLAQTTRDIGKINTNTVMYFLLEQGTSISRSLSGLKSQYETAGFTCEKTN